MRTLPVSVPSGPGITSNVLPTGASALAVQGDKLQVFTGVGFGFIIEPLAGTFPSVVAVEVGGVGKQGSTIIYCTVNKWYDLPFTYLRIIWNDVITAINALGYTQFTGPLGINVATQSFAFVRPAATTNIPASGGGMPGQQVYAESSALTRAAPTVAGDSSATVSVGGESVLSGYINTVAGDFGLPLITGGAVDVWWYNPTNASWHIALQDVPIPTGAAFVHLIFNGELSVPLGVRKAGDRYLIAANGVLTDVAGASNPGPLLVTTVIQ